MSRIRATTTVGTLCASLAVLTGCAVADPDTSQAALHYSGGPFSSQAFQDCINPGVREVDGVGDYHFYYPQGQRTFTFSDAPGSDVPPLRVSTRNQTELSDELIDARSQAEMRASAYNSIATET